MVVAMEFTESLLNSGPTNSPSDPIISDLKHNMSQLQHTVSDLEQKLSVSLVLLGKQQRTVTEMNKTIIDQKQTIDSLERQNMYYNATITDQRWKMENLDREQNVKSRIQQTKIEILEQQETEQNFTISNLLDIVVVQNQTINNQQIELNVLREQVMIHNETISEQGALNKQIAQTDRGINDTFSAYQLILRDVVDKFYQHVNQSNNKTQAMDQKMADLRKQFQYLSLSLVDTEKKTSALNSSLEGMLSYVVKELAQIHGKSSHLLKCSQLFKNSF